MVKIALFRKSHRRVPHRMSTKAPLLCRWIHPGRSLQKSQSSLRGLCIATWQYSSLCVSALASIIGGSDDMEVDVQDKEQVDSETENRDETRRNAWSQRITAKHTRRTKGRPVSTQLA